jgi:hypothetical protein
MGNGSGRVASLTTPGGFWRDVVREGHAERQVAVAVKQHRVEVDEFRAAQEVPSQATLADWRPTAPAYLQRVAQRNDWR